MMQVLTWLKDALLTLLICSTLVSIKKSKKNTFIYLGMVIIMFFLGYDLW